MIESSKPSPLEWIETFPFMIFKFWSYPTLKKRRKKSSKSHKVLTYIQLFHIYYLLTRNYSNLSCHYISISWPFFLIYSWGLNIVNFFGEHPIPISELRIYSDKSLYSIQGITKWFPSSIITDAYKEIMTDMSKLELSFQFKWLCTKAEMYKSQFPGNEENRIFRIESRHL